MDNNRKKKLYDAVCMENKKQIKLYSPGSIQLHIFAIVHTHRASFVCYLPNNQVNTVQLHLFVIVYSPRGMQLHLSVIVHNRKKKLYDAVCMENNKQIELYSLWAWKITNKWRCITLGVHTHRAIQLHIFAIVHTHSASFVCYLPNNQDNMVQLHLFVIVYTHRGIELDLSVIVYSLRNK
jgi:hypothetical protein